MMGRRLLRMVLFGLLLGVSAALVFSLVLAQRGRAGLETPTPPAPAWTAAPILAPPVVTSAPPEPTPRPAADPRYLVRLRPVERWSEAEKVAVQEAAGRVAEILAEASDRGPDEAFLAVYGGPVEFRKTDRSCEAVYAWVGIRAQCANPWGLTENAQLVWVFPGASPSPQWAAHELGHAFSLALGRIPEADLPAGFLQRECGFAGGFGEWQFSKLLTPGEIFADTFVGWAFSAWDRDNLSRQAWFEQRLEDWLLEVFE